MVDWKLYAKVKVVLIIFVSVYHARYSDVWHAFGRFVVNTFYCLSPLLILLIFK